MRGEEPPTLKPGVPVRGEEPPTHQPGVPESGEEPPTKESQPELSSKEEGEELATRNIFELEADLVSTGLPDGENKDNQDTLSKYDKGAVKMYGWGGWFN